MSYEASRRGIGRVRRGGGIGGGGWGRIGDRVGGGVAEGRVRAMREADEGDRMLVLAAVVGGGGLDVSPFLALGESRWREDNGRLRVLEI